MMKFSKLRFFKFKKFYLQIRFWGFLTHIDIIESEAWEQNCMWFFYYFNFECDYEVLKSKGSCILLNKNINYKNETE